MAGFRLLGTFSETQKKGDGFIFYLQAAYQQTKRKGTDLFFQKVKILSEGGALLMPDAAPTPAAERQRRHRERRRAGIFVAPVQVTGQMVEALFKRGDLCEADALDLDCVGKAIAAAARRGLDLT